MTPLAGGWSGETFLADSGGERQVVRIYAAPGDRGAAAAEIDAALLRLVRGLLPVPPVLEVRRGDKSTDRPALLVTAFVEGERGDLLLPTLDADGLATVGRRVGELVGTLGGMPMLRSGLFVDGDLTVGAEPVPPLEDWVALHEARLTGWSDAELAGLAEVAGEAQDDLDTVDRVCLVHSDVNPKNLLVDPSTLQVTALLDWEFAHAGHPFTDLGNVLRFDRQPAYADAVLTAYADLRGTPVDEARHLARAADLLALVELAARAPANPVAERAERLLRTIAHEQDRHAWPV